MSKLVEELKLSIYKILKEANKWYREDFVRVGALKAPAVRGLLPTWQTRDNVLTVRMEAEHCNYVVVSFEIKSGELFLTDLTFHVSPEVIYEFEGLELMLLGLVRLYASFKEARDAS